MNLLAPAESLVVETGENPLPWTAAEQKLFEQALRTYPSGTAERWDKIARCLPTRSKRDCMSRFKVCICSALECIFLRPTNSVLYRQKESHGIYEYMKSFC